MAYQLSVNGAIHSVEVDPGIPVLWMRPDVLGITGTKFGCGRTLCGASTVHPDKTTIRFCITAIDSVGNTVPKSGALSCSV